MKRIILAVLASALASGCGSGGFSTPADPKDLAYQGIMNEVADLLLNRKMEGPRPPSDVKDLEKYRVGWPNGFKQIQQGDIVVAWGAPLVEGASDSILAHQKQCPDSGGFVLMQDGTTIKKLTADEFKSAKKAGKD